VEAERAKIYHHRTPRQYLLPWADSDDRVAWYGYGKVMRSGLTVVGGEDNFYKLKELTVPDVDCMKLFIDGLPELGRKGHKRFLQMYVLPTRLKRHLEKRGDCGPDAMKLVDVVRSNLMENYHASIERGFWPYLDLIKARDFSFIEDLNRAIEFFHGFSVQYMRTKAVKERAIQKTNVLFDDVERVWDVLSYITAVETGRSFFADRRNFQILVLDNDTQVPVHHIRPADHQHSRRCGKLQSTGEDRALLPTQPNASDALPGELHSDRRHQPIRFYR
jgi:hypothetical protein